MSTIKNYVTLTLLLLSTYIYSQDSKSTKVNSRLISGFYFNTGFESNSPLKSNSNEPGDYNYYESSQLFELGLLRNSHRNKSFQYRVGLGFNPNKQVYFGGTGDSQFLDSLQLIDGQGQVTHLVRYRTSHEWSKTRAQELRLNTAMTYYFNPENRLSFYVGLGANIARTFNRQLEEFNYTYDRLETLGDSQLWGTMRDLDNFLPGPTSPVNLKPVTTLGLSATVGADFTLGKTGFWSKSKLFVEGTFSNKIEFGEDISTSTYFSLRGDTGLKFIF